MAWLRPIKTLTPRTRATATSRRTAQRRGLGLEFLVEPAGRGVWRVTGLGEAPSTPDLVIAWAELKLPSHR